MTTLLIATRNTHKVEEIRAILSARFDYLTLRDFPAAPNLREDTNTFAGNATQKAIQLARWLGQVRGLKSKVQSGSRLLVLADDSGLEVNALGGAPGVHSARFAALDDGREGNSPDAENNTKLLRLLKDVPADQRTARFRCVLALVPVLEPSKENTSPVCAADEYELQTELFEGTCEGRIGFAPGGQGGFGYDPLFIPDGHQKTFAELGEAAKNQISHRAKALAKLRRRLGQLGGG